MRQTIQTVYKNYDVFFVYKEYNTYTCIEDKIDFIKL